MRLSESTIAIVGLGLMGGSLALALHGKCRRVIGVARRPDVAQQALDRGVIDAACDLSTAATEADIVVLATPVRHILATVPEVASYMRPGALLLDLGSTKGCIVEAMSHIPAHVAAVGGHPMCGKETGGLESADASLYKGAAFVLTPTARTTGPAMLLAHELAEAVGAHPLVLDAERHDRAAAAISHLPYLLAAALVHAEIRQSAQDPAVGALAASGFRDTTRLAASQPDMMLDILLTNRHSIEPALDLFERKLAEMRALLSDPDRLKQWMAEARQHRMEMYR